MITVFMMLSTLFFSCTKEEAGTGSALPGSDPAIMYIMPEESAPHEGTRLQWPHEYQYGRTYRDRLDATWTAMTAALVHSEKVHLVVYDHAAQARVQRLLTDAGISLNQVDFTISPTDDVWVRDNGPVYVKDKQGKVFIEDWDLMVGVLKPVMQTAIRYLPVWQVMGVRR